MPLDINGVVCSNTAGTVSLGGLNFNTTNGISWVPATPGFCGWKDDSSDNAYQSPSNAAWPINVFQWNPSGMTGGNFVCPVGGWYLCSCDGIVTGGQDVGNGYGYVTWSKNLVILGWTHYNMNLTSGNNWSSAGISFLFNCSAGDTLRMHVNTAPGPVSPAGYPNASGNYGMYPHAHGAAWCIKVG